MGLSPAPGMVLDCGRSRPEVIATRWSRSGLWFVLAVRHPDDVGPALQRISRDTGVEILPFPKEREYFVNLYLPA